jgi:hypothetical protein
MVDRYTKAVLTVIAAALTGLFVTQLTPPARAQISAGCGTDLYPCYIKTQSPLMVEIAR